MCFTTFNPNFSSPNYQNKNVNLKPSLMETNVLSHLHKKKYKNEKRWTSGKKNKQNQYGK